MWPTLFVTTDWKVAAWVMGNLERILPDELFAAPQTPAFRSPSQLENTAAVQILTRMRSAIGACLLVATSSSLLAQGARQTDAPGLFLKAAELSDVRAPGRSPFQLSAHVQILGKGGKPQAGTYLLVWASQNQWHEEIKLPGYQRVRFGGPEKYWQVRSTDYEPSAIRRLDEMLAFVAELRHRAKQRHGKIKPVKRNGMVVNCVEPAPMTGTAAEFCFDEKENTLVRGERLDGEISAREYGDYISFGTAYFPRAIRAFSGNKPVITFVVDELVPFSLTDPSLFVPPANADIWESCEAPTPPQLILRKLPRRPASAKARQTVGTVHVYAVVATDGTLQNIRVLESPDPDLSAAFVQALHDWKFEPATCNGHTRPAPGAAHRNRA